MSALVGVQRRFMELGRIRLGDKGAKGQPQKLTQFRLTSASKPLLEAAAVIYGGTVDTWEGAPDEGYFELYTTSDTLDVIVPPTFSQRDGSPSAPYSQYFELWSGGGCTRRCDGETELITGKPCQCDPDNRACKITTRASLMLPRIPGLGVWRLESHGWNAATEMTGTLELLRMAAEGNQFIRAYLRIEQRTQKVPGEPTRRFIVPVLDLPDTTIGELALATGSPLAINAPAPPPERPALPASPPPVEARLVVEDAEVVGFGEAPALPSPPPVVVDDGAEPERSPFRPPPGAIKQPSAAMLKKLNVLYGSLPRDHPSIITEDHIIVAAWRSGTGDDSPVPEGVTFSMIRDGLTFDQAHTLIDKLEEWGRKAAAKAGAAA